MIYIIKAANAAEQYDKIRPMQINQYVMIIKMQ